jgi:hypothetical protein
MGDGYSTEKTYLYCQTQAFYDCDQRREQFASLFNQ